MITRATLDAHCRQPAAEMTRRQAFAACRAFGPFACWWLADPVRAKAAQFDNCFPQLTGDPPPCPTDPGACNILLVSSGEYPVLAPAFVLPVRWQRGQPHRGLPAALTAVADLVQRQFRESGWGLCPAVPGWREPWPMADDLHLTFESAWAALAGGLVLARHGLHSRPGVFASACWDDGYGAKSVEGLKEKLGAVRRHGGTDLAVAPGQFEEVRAVGSPAAAALNTGRTPRTAVQPLLAQLGARPEVDPTAPDRDEQFRLAVAHYSQVLPFRSPEHRHYYFDELVPVVCDRMRGHLRPDGTGRPRALAAVVSDGWELIPVLAAAFGVERVLLLHTSDYARHLPAVRERLDERVAVAPDADGLFRIPTMRSEFRARLTKFVSDPTELLIDVTLGTALMSLTLEQIARAWSPSPRLVYLAHRTPDGRVEPGREYPLVWRADAEMPELPPELPELTKSL